MIRTRLSPVVVGALLTACGGGPTPVVVDPNALTEGVAFTPAGCPFTVTTPAETTAPLPDTDKGEGPPSALHLSFTGDPSTSVSVVWRTDVDSLRSRVEYGETTSYGQTATGVSFAYPVDLAGTDVPSVRVHEVHICGLTPGKLYHFRAGGGTLFSADAAFTTAPAPGDGKPLRFAVAGDSRDDHPLWGKLLASMAQTGPQLLLYTGDAVALGTIQTAWDSWFAAGKDVLPSLPMQFALGNHEISSRHVFSQLALPGNEQWYSFDHGDVHFVVLADTPRVDSTIEKEQVAFLDDDLGKTTRKWKVVMHHKAIFSSSTHGSQTRLQAAWMPLYDKHNVDVVFNGHDHDYERSKPMRAGQVAAIGSPGTTYIVNGGGGAMPYPSATSSFTAFSKTAYGYSIVDVVANQMTITSYELAGGVATQIDQVVLSK